MNILVLNCGSSSLKWQLIATDPNLMEQDQDQRLGHGVFERIGSQALVSIYLGEDTKPFRDATALRDHKAAIDYLLSYVGSNDQPIPGIAGLQDIHAVGHRIVHGGEEFKTSVRITPDVLRGIESCIELAPMHNPANLQGIAAATTAFGLQVPQVAVFDTAFHESLPEDQYLYAIPYHYYRRYKIRRYGFHGTSHRYVAYRYRKQKGLDKSQVKILTVHLGNGCSICAIEKGRSVATSMGMTPTQGLVMGTRSGDLDPAIIEFLSHKEGIDSQQVLDILNQQSGLLGVSGLTNDMRELLEEEHENQDRRARLAIDMFCKRVKQYIGSYMAALNGVDGIVFTGGIGSGSAQIREQICSGMEWLGIHVDAPANAALGSKGGSFSTEQSRVSLHSIPTDEELLIARDTVRVMDS